MNLTIDIGNSRIKAGVFKNNTIVAHQVIEENPLRSLQNWVKKYSKINNAIICSTTDYPKGIKAFLNKNFKLVELSSKTPLPFRNAYKTPETLGKDRLASVAGAQHVLPGKAILIINAGTCVTYDLVDKNKKYHGGSISPGLDMRFKALHTFTGRLPLIEANTGFDELTGKTTRESILSGVQNGMIEEIQGFINAYKKRYSNLHIILTGGSSQWIKTKLKSKIIFEPLLTLKGLNVILALCQNQKP